MATLYRRMANVPTSGGARVDRILLAIAERLERKASLAQEPPDKPVADGPPSKKRRRITKDAV